MTSQGKQEQVQAQVAALMQRGRLAARAGQRARARRYFAAVLELDPAHKEAWLARADVVDDAREAMAHLAQVLALDPGDQQARERLREQRRPAGNLPAADVALPAGIAPAQAPVPRPLVAVPDPAGRRAGLGLGLWTAVGLLAAVLVLALALWSDTPHTVLAALLPSPTPTATATPTPTATPRPTFTPTPTSTPTSTPTPTFTPTPTPTPTVKPTKVPPDKSESEKWIEVDLSEQRLYAHEGQTTVLNARVSTGTWQYPTVKGRFKIYAKYRATRMTGPGYDLPNVPWTMFFYAGYAIHGTYWHNNFGTPMSHGCVNMKTPEAKWLFNWAPKGTLVVVHK
jgi:lipoprotein-anchoring transpeptidase ErfK/SrfK